jgi:hypothetical protein
MSRPWMVLVPVIAVLSIIIWASDFVTLQGERTIYTVRCELGTWVGDQCLGKLVAAERFRFRALNAHGEVLFWIVGSSEPSGKFTECVIKDGRNWSCKANADAAKSITLEIAQGHPMPDPSGTARPFHAVSKLTWMSLKYRMPFGDAAVSNAQTRSPEGAPSSKR